MREDLGTRCQGWRVGFCLAHLWLAVAGSAWGATNESPPRVWPRAWVAKVNDLVDRAPGVPLEFNRRHEWENLNLYVRKTQHLVQGYPASSVTLAMLEGDFNQATQSLAVVAGDRPATVIRGLREEAYYCDVDDSFQPFIRYLPMTVHLDRKQPLLVFLHGYSPTLDIVNWGGVPTNLTALADRLGFCVLLPFGRSNTDYQGIGEQDVLCAIAEMKERYPIDEERIVLSGHSMGGMGVWTVGARHPGMFAGLAVFAGRGDYYFWKQVKPEDLPSYKRALIDVQFGYSLLQNLKQAPVFSVHGARDPLIPVAEGRRMMSALAPVNRDATYVEWADESHWLVERTLACDEFRVWLSHVLRVGRKKGSATTVSLNASVCGGPISRAFLSPFIFVCAWERTEAAGCAAFARRVMEWYRFTKAIPRTAMEDEMTPAQLTEYNVILFGEPERSPLIQAALKDSPVRIEGDDIVVGEQRYPRKGHGLYLVRPSPWAAGRLVVVQCGIPWGDGLSANHKYDLLPDYIVYTADQDADGSNTARCAGFFDKAGGIEPTRLYLGKNLEPVHTGEAK